MTTTSQNVSPFSRFSRALGLSSKFNTVSPRPKLQSSAKTKEVNEDWYIPYNGPYEPPKPVVRREKERDSWGDPIDGEDDDDAEDHVLVDPELHNRYGQISASPEWSRGGENTGVRRRSRTQSGGSVFSGRTGSSGTVDPGRGSLGVPRRSTVSGSNQLPPIPPFASLDVAGGVGDSPVPLVRGSSSSTPTRKSLASLFTFNSSSKKRPSSSSTKPPPDLNRQPGTSTAIITKPDGQSGMGNPKTSTSDIKQHDSIPPLPSDPNLATEALRASGATNDEDYYNSYYSTLLNLSSNTQHLSNTGTSDPPDSNTRQPTHIPEEPHSSASDASSALHPYAYTFPSTYSSDVPQSAPPMQKTHFQSIHTHLDPTRTAVFQTSSPPHLRHLALPPQNSLSHSASTPNLRANARPSYNQTRKNFKDRLLSAETWCDALLFPRPRLKVKRDGASGESTPSYRSGRIVSPPGSPVADYFSNRLAAESGIASRVLAHSRSLVDLSASQVAGPSVVRREEPPPPPRLPEPKVAQGKKPEILPLSSSQPPPVRPPRPKSWALDDLVLPSPVPSLSRVLEEGQILEHQRKKWQTQAINSFQNERARALSRARTKSLRSKKRQEKPNTLEFLAARGLLGNQDPIHVHLPPPRPPYVSRPRTASETDSRGTWSMSHGHSNSLSKTVSKSSKTHSRSNSLGKSAIQIAKSTAKSTVTFCRTDGGGIVITPVEERNKEQVLIGEADGFDGAIRTAGTRVIRLIDPAQTHVPFSPISPLDVSRLSPAPSASSNVRVGIAISTPPLTDEAIDRESIRIPAHPYAQGGLTVSVSSPTNQVNKGTTVEPPVRSPTYGSPSIHPYALVSAAPSVDSSSSEGRIVPEARPDSLVPPAEKMWAQWGSGVVREILPSDLQYSPFVSNQHFTAPEDSDKAVFNRTMRNSSPIYDTAGIGEALVWAAKRQSRDSGLGASEEQGSSNFVRNSQVVPGNEAVGIAAIAISEKPSEQVYASARRIPVQYDASRPAHMHHARMNSTSAPSPLSRVQPDLAASAIPSTSKQTAPIRTDSIVSSPDESSSSSSPPITSPVLGNPDDLEKYRDLFYRPRGLSVDGPTPPLNPRSPHQPNNIPWDVRSQNTSRTGLTSIVHQLNEELDVHDENPRRSISLSSRSSLSVLRQSAYVTGRSPPTDSTLRFVFSDIPETASVEAVTRVKPIANDNEPHTPFYPSVKVPEDIETSTRASSPTSPIDDEALGVYRLGSIETTSTPLAESSDPRLSYVGQMSYAHEDIQDDEHEDVLGISPNFSRQPATAHSSLQPPSADPTRSSYMTSNSEGSRISGLSDFPAPPPQHLTPAHMSLLSSYFDETLTANELAQVQAQGVHSRPGTRSRSGSVTAQATLGRHGQTEAGDHLDRDRSLDDNNHVIDDLLEKLSPI